MPSVVPTDRPEERRSRLVVCLASAVYAIFFSWYALRKAAVFDWFSSDLGNMWQTIWNAGHGHGFQFTSTTAGQSVARLAIHADYLLVLLAPLSWIWSDARILVVVQVTGIATGAWFVFRLAEAFGAKPWLAAVWAGGYLLYGPLQYAILWQFHAITLSVTFILGAAEAVMNKRRPWVYWLWFGLALITKEQVGFIIGLMGLVLWWRHQRVVAWGSLGVGWVWSLLHFGYIIPFFRPAGSPHLFWGYYFPEQHGSTIHRLSSVLSPGNLWRALGESFILHNLLFLLAPLAFLALLSGWFWLALAAVAPEWLSTTPEVHSLYTHNNVLAIPFLFLGALAGWRWAQKHWPGPRLSGSWATGFICFWILVGTAIISPLPWNANFQPDLLANDPALIHFGARVAQLPSTAAVTYTLGLGNFARSRFAAFAAPDGLEQADYVVWHDPPALRSQRAAFIQHRQIITLFGSYLQASKAFAVSYQGDGGMIYRRDHRRPLEPFPPEIVMYLDQLHRI